MDNFDKNQTCAKEHNANGGRRHARIEETTNELLDDGKRLANELYEGGMEKVNQAEKQIKEYSDELLKKVQENPLSSILIAGAVGFVLSALLKK